jgi:hypothetical protein
MVLNKLYPFVVTRDLFYCITSFGGKNTIYNILRNYNYKFKHIYFVLYNIKKNFIKNQIFTRILKILKNIIYYIIKQRSIIY